MKTLTVITATYNRAYCLHQVYESLCRQTSQDFLWLVIDDGSTDNTRELISKWIAENKIEIEYYYQENGGVHRAFNTAYERVHTELNVAVDSDDWLKDDAVEKIVNFWNTNKSPYYCGIIALDVSPDGKLVGTMLPENIKACTSDELYDRYKIKGDKKFILRSDLSRLYPFPEFEGEKYYAPSYKYMHLGLYHKFLLMNEAVCVVEYHNDGITFNKRNKKRDCYRSSAKGFAHYRNAVIRISDSPMFIVKHMIHYIAESIMANDSHYIIHSSKKLYAILCWPAGLIYYYYINYMSAK